MHERNTLTYISKRVFLFVVVGVSLLISIACSSNKSVSSQSTTIIETTVVTPTNTPTPSPTPTPRLLKREAYIVLQGEEKYLACSESYDEQGQLIEEYVPEKGTTVYKYNDDGTLNRSYTKQNKRIVSQHDYTYNSDGLLIQEDQGITRIIYSYDNNDRLEQIQYLYCDYGSDVYELSSVASYSYDEQGLLLQVTFEDHTNGMHASGASFDYSVRSDYLNDTNGFFDYIRTHYSSYINGEGDTTIKFTYKDNQLIEIVQHVDFNGERQEERGYIDVRRIYEDGLLIHEEYKTTHGSDFSEDISYEYDDGRIKRVTSIVEPYPENSEKAQTFYSYTCHVYEYSYDKDGLIESISLADCSYTKETKNGMTRKEGSKEVDFSNLEPWILYKYYYEK